MNINSKKNILLLIFGVSLITACSQDGRFPLLGDGWKRISDCEMNGGAFDMIVQVNESTGKAVIAYFDSEDTELYRDSFTKDPDDYSDGKYGLWYFLDGGDMDDDKVLIKTNKNPTVTGRKSDPYRVWFWSSGENYYCDNMQ